MKSFHLDEISEKFGKLLLLKLEIAKSNPFEKIPESWILFL